MVGDQISARKLGALLALAVLALLLAQPWAARSAGSGATTGARVAAPFAAIPPGANSVPDAAGPKYLGNGMAVGHSVKNDTSAALRDIPPVPGTKKAPLVENENPGALLPHKDQLDNVVQKIMAPLAMPTPILNFNGIPFPGVACNCAPPDTDGEVGDTQYVQMVNEGYQVFNKATGASVYGPVSIATLWSGFGGACQTGGSGDPIVLYDQVANRWLISQFATATGGTPITDECIAVSTSSDATGSFNRYDFHLGSNFYDYPHLGVWPDAYYMSDNVFNAAGNSYLGPQPFAFDRAAMLAGTAATFVTTASPLGSSVNPILPADLDGSNLPASGAPESFIRFPGAGAYQTYHFHVDFPTPANSTWTTFAAPAAAGFTQLCPASRSCVPQLGSADGLDGIGDRLMFRLAYRKFADGHESVVGNYSVSSGGVAGVRWFELRNVTSGPVTVFQESTYQPDTTWRWMGSAAMDTAGDIAVGFSASSASINPQIRYAGRLVSDPINQLAQGEATLFAGTGSQTGTGNRWGDYSDMTVDPVDDCTIWYTQEYYQTTGSFNWRTRIGNFKFPGCAAGTPTPTPTGILPTITPTATPTQTPCAISAVLLSEGFESGLGSFASAVATCVPGGCGWSAVTTDKHSGVQSAFAPDLNNVSDQRLTLNSGISIPANATGAVLSFWHRVDTENTYDGGVLEFSTDGGSTWSTSTPAFITGAYNGTISPSFSNPLAGRSAWTGTIGSAGSFDQVQVDLLSYAGQNLLFRFREGTDISVGSTGWWVDDVSVTITTPCTTPQVTSTSTSTGTATRTSSPTNTPTRTNTQTNTSVPTNTSTRTSTLTNTPAPTNTATRTGTPTSTGVPTNTSTATTTRTFTVTPTGTRSPTNTPTVTPTAASTGTNTPTNNPTNTNTATPVVTSTPTSTSVPPTLTGTPPSTTTPTGGSPTATPTECTINFTDVHTTDYFYQDVRCVFCLGAVSGYSDGSFRPFNNNTRGQMTKIIVIALRITVVTPTGTPTFNDVPVNSPFYAWIETSAAHGIVSGYNCGGVGEPCPGLYFRPNANVTRGQLSKIVVVAANQVFGWAILNPATPTFTDVPVGSAFYPYIETAVCHGVVSGYSDQTFRPGNNAIRAQIAKIVCRTSQNPASTCNP